MKLTLTPIVIGTLGTIPKESVKKLEDIDGKARVETIQT